MSSLATHDKGDSAMDSKEVPAQGQSLNEIDDDADTYDDASGQAIVGFTKRDAKDMRRMGKKQELMRNFRRLSAFSFTVILTATWEYLLIANSQGLANGGLAGLWWEWVWTFFGFGLIMLSLAEMASMAPTSGGQYHWVSEFAPPKYQKPLSYLTGWMSALSWQAGNASGSFLTGSMIQALITINNPNYSPTNWQETLLIFAMVVVLFVANVFGAKGMPIVQNMMLVFHVVLFLVIVIVLWTKAPLNSAHTVFTQFNNGGGWSSVGMSLMIGQITAIYTSVGSDAPAHMAEEIKDAGLNVPNAMVWSYVLNEFLATILLVTYLFAMPSVSDALNDPTYFPFIYVFKQALPTSGVNALVILIMFLVIAANIDYNASTARQTFAFARDKGFPFHAWIGKVHPTMHIPANAIAVTCLITCLLALINIGSSVAFNAIISLQIVALMFSYTISIGCVLYRRVAHPELLPPARWSLGKWGIPINSTALVYAIFAFFWCFWPGQTPVGATTFNWGVVMFFGIALISAFWYMIVGRKIYKGPFVSKCPVPVSPSARVRSALCSPPRSHPFTQTARRLFKRPRARSKKRQEQREQAKRGKSLVHYLAASNSGHIRALSLTLFACGGATLISVAYNQLTLKSPQASAESPVPETSTSVLPLADMPIPAGHLGNLTPDQEAKLRQFWATTLRVFGVETPAVANGANTDPASIGERVETDSPNTATPDKKKRKSIFGRHKDKEPKDGMENGASSPGMPAADEDKYGQVKEFHEILEKQSPEELRTAFWDMVKADHPDALLLRFLRARKWDVDKALVMLISTMHWRSAAQHVDDDVVKHGEGRAVEDSKSSDKAVKREGDDFLQQLRLGKSFLHGTDKEGRPLCVVRVRLHKPGEQTEKSLERYTVYIIETARLVLRPPVETACIVFDMTHFGLSNMDYAPVKFMIKCFEANYPESLGAVLVHKAPFLFNAIWNIIKGWLDPVVAGKIHFTKHDKDLEQYIPKSQIMHELGGEEAWEYKYVEPVPGENALMQEEAPRKKLQEERTVDVLEFQKKTFDWIAKGADDSLRRERDAIAQKLYDNYWQLDPYIRARTIYDRVGMIQTNGKINFYPPPQQAVNGAPPPPQQEASANDVD